MYNYECENRQHSGFLCFEYIVLGRAWHLLNQKCSQIKPIFNSGLPDFSWHNIPKRGEFTKWPQTIPNGHKIYQMTGKWIHRMASYYTNIFHGKTLKS
jgi:hypothetical protein